MSYTPNTWSTGDTITAAKLNNIEQGIVGAESSGGSEWDAVIRLVHANNSGNDTTANLTPSIVSGTFAELVSILQDERLPRILVEYIHPWGYVSVMPVGLIGYSGGSFINLLIAGLFDGYNDNARQFKVVGTLIWGMEDSLTWRS